MSNETSSKKASLTDFVSIISWRSSGKQWRSSVEIPFITSKYTNFLLFDLRYGSRCQSKQSNRRRVRLWILHSEGTPMEGKLSGHSLSSSVQYFNTFDTTVKRIIKQQGHEACLNLTALSPPRFLSGEMGENMREKPQVKALNYPTNLKNKMFIQSTLFSFY